MQQDAVLADAQKLSIDGLYKLPPLRMRPAEDEAAAEAP